MQTSDSLEDDGRIKAKQGKEGVERGRGKIKHGKGGKTTVTETVGRKGRIWQATAGEVGGQNF